MKAKILTAVSAAKWDEQDNEERRLFAHAAYEERRHLTKHNSRVEERCWDPKRKQGQIFWC